MRPRVLQASGFFLLLAIVLAASKDGFPQAPSQTLGEVLARKSLPLTGGTRANLERKITSAAQVDDHGQFATAYYLDDGSGILNPPLFVDH